MPRSMWKGAISFGLVTIPVAVYPATEEKTLRFNQLHDEDMGRVRNKRVCEKCGQEITFEHIVKGYEYEKDHYAVMTDDDFDAVPLESSRAIDIVQFVDLEEIDPVYYKKSYYLIPGPDRGEGLRAAARGHEPGQQGGDRQGQLPRQGAPGRPALPRRRVRPGDDVLARRDPRPSSATSTST